MEVHEHLNRIRTIGFSEPEDAEMVLNQLGELINKNAALLGLIEGMCQRIALIESQLASVQRLHGTTN